MEKTRRNVLVEVLDAMDSEPGEPDEAAMAWERDGLRASSTPQR